MNGFKDMLHAFVHGIGIVATVGLCAFFALIAEAFIFIMGVMLLPILIPLLIVSVGVLFIIVVLILIYLIGRATL